MKLILSVLLLAASQLVLAKPLSPSGLRRRGVLGRDIGVARFTGNLDGYDIDMNGTLNDVFAAMEVLYPTFNSKLYLKEAREEANSIISAVKEKRNKSPPPLCCPVNVFQEAPWQAIANGVAALANEGRYTVGAQSCGEIWNECGGDGLAGTIWLCNDNHYSINPALPYMATYAQDIMNDCTIWDGDIEYACGQEFDTDSYNIVVQGEDC